MSDEYDQSSTDDHPLYDLVGVLDEERASQVREEVERFRERLDEDLTP